MKELLLRSLFLLGFAGTASATLQFVTPCFVDMPANTSGNESFECSATPDPGFHIDSLTLSISETYLEYAFGSPVVFISGTLTQSSPVFEPFFCPVTTLGTNPVGCQAVIAPSATVSNLDLPSYTAQLTGVSNTGSLGSGFGQALVTMTLDATEASDTPEPATLGLTGAGLLGLCLVARKGIGHYHPSVTYPLAKSKGYSKA